VTLPFPHQTGRGQVFDNPLTGEHTVILTDPFTHPDRTMVGHLTARPGTRVAGPHIHPKAVERFHVVRGTVGFHIDGNEHLLGPGESAEVPAGVLHDWWQVGDQEARVVVDVTPGDRAAQAGLTMFGLARDGKVNRKGLPSLLQSAVTMHEFRDVVLMGSPPAWVQRLLSATLAPLGRMAGLRPWYPQYLHSDVLAEPAAEALALLDERDRLRWNTNGLP
jgi:quercetin dioxygenase-like cupin family protein